MPFTPLHMGLGLVAKSSKPTHFSFLMFGLSQVAMDIQPLLSLTGVADIPLHEPTHSLIGAAVIGLACLPFRRLLGWLFQQPINSRAAVAGAFVGTYSHLLLDGIVHPDVSAGLFWPYQAESHLYGLLSWDEMTWVCLGMGAVGFVVLLIRGEVQDWISKESR